MDESLHACGLWNGESPLRPPASSTSPHRREQTTRKEDGRRGHRREPGAASARHPESPIYRDGAHRGARRELPALMTDRR